MPKQLPKRPLRMIRDGCQVPLTLHQTTALLSHYGVHCTVYHLHTVERGTAKGASPRLLAALAAVYGVSREAVDDAYLRGRRLAQRASRRRGENGHG